jgi:hypothetical protein
MVDPDPATRSNGSSEQRSLRARIAAETSWANTLDPTARTAPARAALAAKFLAEADGDPVRAEHLRKAHYLKMALKSARVRKAKSLAVTDARQ